MSYAHRFDIISFHSMFIKILHMRKSGIGFLLIISFLSFSVAVTAQVTGIPNTVGKGIVVPVSEIIKLTEEEDKQPRQIYMRPELHTKHKPQQIAGAKEVSKWPDTISNITEGINATQTIHSNFLGIRVGESGSIPPDNQGDVGPSQICIPVNGRIKVFNKNTVCVAAQTTPTGASNTVLASPVLSLSLNAFFVSVRNGAGVSDPHVRYDRLSQRWFIIAINTPPIPVTAASRSRVMIAVSSGSTITNLASFTFFFFEHDLLLPAPPPAYNLGFYDYPTLGVDANALYIGGVMFNAPTDTYLGASVFVVRKSSILGAGPMVVTPFHNVGTNSAGMYVPQGVQNDNPAATEGYFIGADAVLLTRINMFRVTTPGATPVLSSLLTITPPAATQVPILQDHNTGVIPIERLDAIDDRFYAATIMKNKITGTQTLWTAHHFQVNTLGVASNSGGRNGSRWYEIGSLNTTPTVVQLGTVFDATSTASNPRGYWFPSIAASGQGHAVIGMSTASAINFVDATVAGRYRTDASGTTQAPVLATAASTAYNREVGVDGKRWGDYSQTVVDPSDNMTIWTFQQYTNNTDSWGVRAIQLRAPSPATPTSPGTIGCGTNAGGGNRSTVVTVNGTSVDNTEFFDPGNDAGGPGFANRLNVATTGAGASVNGINFVSPTQITFNVVWPAGLAGTTQTLTITNPDCQSVTTTYTLPTGCSSLPVTYVNFTGKEVNKKVLLTWETSFETNNQFFEVEKKSATNSFETIGLVRSKGITTGSVYQFIDNNPSSLGFYRIKQVDTDNSFSYSSTISVKVVPSGKFLLYPNPAQNIVSIETPASYTKGVIKVVSATGVLVYTAIIKDPIMQIDMGNFAAGAYIVEIRSVNGEKQQKKLSVERQIPKP
jgi:hypothetical protein